MLTTNSSSPLALKNLTDYYGTLPPVMKSRRTQSQANETREPLLIGVSEKTSDEDGFIEPVSKKQRRFREETRNVIAGEKHYKMKRHRPVCVTGASLHSSSQIAFSRNSASFRIFSSSKFP